MEDNDKLSLLTSVFNAIPSLIFIVDEDVRVQEFNTAVSRFIDRDRDFVLQRRGGDVLNCLHANESEKGCGHGRFCEGCIIRNSVTEAYRGHGVVRRRANIEIIRNGVQTKIYALITVSKFIFNQEQFALLLIEDITEIAELQRLIPICSVCKNIRDEEEAWSRVEVYFREHWDLNFSHSLCPKCYKQHLEKLDNYLLSDPGE